MQHKKLIRILCLVFAILFLLGSGTLILSIVSGWIR